MGIRSQISFHQVYREGNQVADRLSKDGVLLAHGDWIIQEHAGGHIYEYAHPPFI